MLWLCCVVLGCLTGPVLSAAQQVSTRAPAGNLWRAVAEDPDGCGCVVAILAGRAGCESAGEDFRAQYSGKAVSAAPDERRALAAPAVVLANPTLVVFCCVAGEPSRLPVRRTSPCLARGPPCWLRVV